MEEPLALHPVKLYVYDLSKGMARRLSPLMLGKSAPGSPPPRGAWPGLGLRVPRPTAGERGRNQPPPFLQPRGWLLPRRPVPLSRGSGPPGPVGLARGDKAGFSRPPSAVGRALPAGQPRVSGARLLSPRSALCRFVYLICSFEASLSTVPGTPRAARCLGRRAGLGEGRLPSARLTGLRGQPGPGDARLAACGWPPAPSRELVKATSVS